MNLAVVQLNDRTDQRQAKPGTAAFSGGIALIKPVENMLLRVGRDSLAVVLDLQNRRVVLLFESDLDFAAAGVYLIAFSARLKTRRKSNES